LRDGDRVVLCRQGTRPASEIANRRGHAARMHKKLKLEKQTVWRLSGVTLAAVRGARDNDDGTKSGFPVCLSYYGSCDCSNDCPSDQTGDGHWTSDSHPGSSSIKGLCP